MAENGKYGSNNVGDNDNYNDDPCKNGQQRSTANKDIVQEVRDLKGKSWFDAEEERRRDAGRLSLSRIVFVGEVSLLQSDVGEPLSSSKAVAGKNGEGNNDGGAAGADKGKGGAELTTQQERSHAVSTLTSEDTSKHTSRQDQPSLIAVALQDFLSPSDDDDGVDLGVMSGGIVLVPVTAAQPPAIESTEGVPPTMLLVGFVEGPPNDTYGILQKLHNHDENNSRLRFASVRILLASEDCPTRDLVATGAHSLAIYVASPATETGEVDVDSLGADEVAGNIVAALCREASSFLGSASADAKAAISSSPTFSFADGSDPREGSEKTRPLFFAGRLTGRQKKAIPSAKRIAACMMHEAYPSLGDFVDMFCSPIYVEETDFIFPTQPVIDYDEVANLVKAK